MNKPSFNSVSENAKDFIFKATIMDVDQRWSAKQLLNHQWLVSLESKLDQKVESHEMQNVLQNL